MLTIRMQNTVSALLSIAILTFGTLGLARAGSIFDDDYKPANRPEPQQLPKPAPEQHVAPAPIPEPPPAPPRIRPTAVGPTNLVRYPIAAPSEAACAEAVKRVREVYKDEFAQKTVADKAALGLQLLGEAREEGNDAVTRYVLYRNAIDACGAGNDVAHALQAIDEMSWIFAVDRISMTLDQLSAAANDPNTLPWTAHLATGEALSFTAEAVAAGRYADAAKFAMAAQSLARKSHEAALQTWASAWVDQTREIAEKASQIAGDVAKLKVAPDDPTALAELGAFYCFDCGFWDKGLPMLAKGSDALLKSAARKDLSAAETDPAAQAALGDTWISAATNQTGVAKDSILRRACKWYRAALPQLSGLTKLAVQRHISQTMGPQLQHGLAVGVYRGEGLIGRVRTRVDPYIDWNWDAAAPDPAQKHDHFSMRWTGWLKGPSPGTYQILARSDDGVRVWVDGNEVINRWGAGTFSESATVTLGAEPVELCVEYFQYTGSAHLGLGWIIPGSKRARAIPTSALWYEPIEFAQLLTPPLASDSDGIVRLLPDRAQLHGRNIKENPTQDVEDAFLGDWASQDDWASWNFTARSGDYDVSLEFGAIDQCNDLPYVINVGGASLGGKINDTGAWYNWAAQNVGRIHLAGGNEILSIKPTSAPRSYLMNLKSIILTPAKQE